jgi:hypothetical protein
LSIFAKARDWGTWLQNKCNVGYAFINMIAPSRIVPFYQVGLHHTSNHGPVSGHLHLGTCLGGLDSWLIVGFALCEHILLAREGWNVCTYWNLCSCFLCQANEDWLLLTARPLMGKNGRSSTVRKLHLLHMHAFRAKLPLLHIFRTPVWWTRISDADLFFSIQRGHMLEIRYPQLLELTTAFTCEFYVSLRACAFIVGCCLLAGDLCFCCFESAWSQHQSCFLEYGDNF